MTAPELIKKMPLFKGWSYPVKRSDLDGEFEGLVCSDGSSISDVRLFYSLDKYPTLPRYRRSGHVDMKGVSPEIHQFEKIMWCNYDHDFEDGPWQIDIVAVRTEIKPVSVHFSIERGLPLLKQWITQPRSRSWYTEYRALYLGIHKSEAKYMVAELVNDEYLTQDIVSFDAPD